MAESNNYILPFFTDEVEEYIKNEKDNNINSNIDNTEKIYIDIAWYYEKNKPIMKHGDFVIVSGLGAVKSWVFRTLQTQRYRFKIFTWNYGADMNAFVGKILTDKNKIDLIKEITDCLMQNKHIKRVYDFEFNTDDRIVTINFKVMTEYGDLSEVMRLHD